MKIAYIIDSSTNLTQNTKKENIYRLPFNSYNANGVLQNISDSKQLLQLQKDTTEGQKSYVEPTPGSYRDLYQSLQKQGYTNIFVIPQSKKLSISYKNAEYASRYLNLDVRVIDVDDFGLSSTEVVSFLVEDKKIQENIKRIIIDFSVLTDLIRTAITNI